MNQPDRGTLEAVQPTDPTMGSSSAAQRTLLMNEGTSGAGSKDNNISVVELVKLPNQLRPIPLCPGHFLAEDAATYRLLQRIYL